MHKTMKETLERSQVPVVEGLTVIRVQHSDSSIEFGVLHSYDYDEGKISFQVEDRVPPTRYVIKTVSWEQIIDFRIISPKYFVDFLNSILPPPSN